MQNIRWFRSVYLAVSLSSALFAQTGTIQGTIADSGGATIPDASIIAIDQDKGVLARRTTTAPDGSFVLTGLLPGRYNVKVEMAGFKSVDRADLKLDQNQVMNL